MDIRLTLAAVALTAGLALPAAAESFASSASSAGSASVGSISDSIGGSSDASSGRQHAAAGEYRVLAVAPAADGRLAVELQSVDEPARRFTLRLPAQAATLDVGERIAVMARPYGLAFARAAALADGPAAAPFFVALDDDWRHELDLTRVTL